MNLGNAIRKARGNKFSQTEIASLTGVTNVYISMLEKNKRECSLDWLKKFSLTIDVPVPILFFMALDEDDTVRATDEYPKIKQNFAAFVNQCFGIDAC